MSAIISSYNLVVIKYFAFDPERACFGVSAIWAVCATKAVRPPSFGKGLAIEGSIPALCGNRTLDRFDRMPSS